MPELPEVETVKRILAPQIRGRRVKEITVVRPEVLAHPSLRDFCAGVRGSVFGEPGRRGKFLQLPLEGGGAVVVHLRMTGCLLCAPMDYPPIPHTHVLLSLSGGHELRFVDTRRFGRLWLIRAGERDVFTGVDALGPEPFDPVFDSEYLRRRLGGRRTPIKQGLLDQSVVAGIGNIYADETLFAARIHPRRSAARLRPEEWQTLAEAIPRILAQAIAANATSPEDFLAGRGREYANTSTFTVYGREGKPCLRCGALIERTKTAGRSSFYCPACQI